MEENQKNDLIEEIVTRVQQAIEENQKQSRESKTTTAKFFKVITGNWVLFLFFIGVISTAIGWAFFGISPLHTLEEIANNQKEYQRKERLREYNDRIVSRHIKLGNALLSAAQIDAAAIEFEKALELDKYNVDAHFGKMKSEVFKPVENNEYIPEIAEKRIQLLLQEAPSDPHILSFMGEVSKDDPTLAMKLFRQAIEIDSSVAMAYAGIAYLHDIKNNRDSAITFYHIAHLRSKWNQTYLNNLGYQYYLKADYKKAIEYYEKVLSLNSQYALTYYTLSSAYLLSGNAWYSYQYYEMLLELLKNDEIMLQDINKSQWLFHTINGTIYLSELSMKRCYAYYGMAVASFLNGYTAKADMFVKQAEDLALERDWLVKRLVKSDIYKLQNQQNIYIDKLNMFIDRYEL